MYSKCVHCGLCLDNCPTYRALGTEMDSPRGRIYQMLQVDEGRLALADPFVTHIDRCLGCLNCQTACPSGVQYGHLLEKTRAQIEQHYERPWLQRKVRAHFYQSVLPSFGKLSFNAKLLRFYQRSGLQSLARSTGLLKALGVAELDALSPRIESDFSFRDLGKVFPAEGERRGRVALLIGCISSVAFAELNRATIRVLTKNGIEVCIPKAQSCCGALHAHAGYLDLAREQARKNIDAMLGPDVDAIVNNAAGCGATMKEYAVLLEHDAKYAARAQEFVAKVRDITEYLAEVGLREPKRKLKTRVTYSDPCHLAHAQGIRKQPRALLKAIGAEVVEMPRADTCCGSAGVYNVVQNEISMKILDEKMDFVAMVEPEIIATANVGCMLQLLAGTKRKGLHAEVKHVIELLDRAY
ncbi:MAG: heterodisulfide reductase-related iron-sulfur binding cluster [Candidatus Korobacteraceae bacterium]